MITDTHAHLCFDDFSEDVQEVLLRAKEAKLSRIILASSDIPDSQAEIQFAQKWNTADLELWCMVGVHPHEASHYKDEDDNRLRNWIQNRKENRIVAIGEIGLDYHYDHSPRDTQRDVFRKQLDIAWEEDIPFVLHEREATQDSLAILNEYKAAGKLRSVPGVCHCFSGSEETARQLLSMGFYLGFDGPLTFKNSRKAPDVVRLTPLDRLLVETDAPFLAPVPMRGKRNEPAYIVHVLEKMADIKEISFTEMARITTENAARLFL